MCGRKRDKWVANVFQLSCRCIKHTLPQSMAEVTSGVISPQKERVKKKVKGNFVSNPFSMGSQSR